MSQSHTFQRVAYKPVGTIATKGIVGFTVPFLIVGSIVGAVVAATFHHFFDAHLETKEVAGFWDQSTTRRFENAIATMVRFLLSLSAGSSLCQVAWSRARKFPFKIGDLDALLSESSVLSIFHPTLIVRAPAAIAIVIAIAASSMIPVLAPSLTVRPGDIAIRRITVPTLDLVTDRNMNAQMTTGVYGQVSDLWDKAAVQGLVSSTGIHWQIPYHCAPGCQYNVTYSATALRCSDLDPQSISSDGVPSNSTIQDPPAAYLRCYDGSCVFYDGFNSPGFSILNFTIQERSQYDNISANVSAAERDHYGVTVTYLPAELHSGSPGSARGSVCTFYNATYMAQILFVNGTQVNTIQIMEYHMPLNTSTKFAGDLLLSNFQNDTQTYYYPTGEGRNLNLLAMADSFSAHLRGSIITSVHSGIPVFNGIGSLITKVNLFNLVTNDIDTTWSLNFADGVTNLSQGLTDLMANMTLNFMNVNSIGSTSVLANIPSTASVYHYNRRSLIMTYAIAISVMTSAAVLGLRSLVSNGAESCNTFSQILVATRSLDLDSVAREAGLGSAAIHNKSLLNVRVRFGNVGSSLGTHREQAGFEVVAKEELEVDSLKKGD